MPVYVENTHRFHFVNLPGNGGHDGIAQPRLRQRDGDLPIQIPMQRDDGNGRRRSPETFAPEIEPAGRLGLGIVVVVAIALIRRGNNWPP